MILLGFILPVAFIPGVTGAGIPTGWVLLSAVLPLTLLRPVPISPGHWWGVAFLAYATASLAWAYSLENGIEYLWHLVILAMAFCLGSITRDPRSLYIGLGLGITVSSALAVAQAFGYKGIYLFSGTPAGLFINSNALGESAALILVLLVAERIWWLVPGVLPAIALTQARGAVLALSVALGAWVWTRSRLGAVAVVLTLLATGSYFTLLKQTNHGVAQRLEIWADTFSGLRPFGAGAGSFAQTYPAIATRQDTLAERPDNAHNEFLETLYQFGIGACFLWFLCIQSLGSPREPERLAFLAFLVVAFFGFALAVPTVAFVGAFVAGRLNTPRPVDGLECSDSRLALSNRVG